MRAPRARWAASRGEVRTVTAGERTAGERTLGGANPGDFSVDPGLSLTIQPGDAPQPVAVSCTPTELGTRSATLTLATNDGGAPSPSFTLLCTGAAAPAPAFGSTPAAPGLLSIGDAVKSRMDQLEFERDQLTHYLHGQ